MNEVLRKRFITLEGGEGSGKTTACKKLKEYFENKNEKVIITREPGGVEIAEKIRELILNNDIHPETEAHLFAAARIEHINNLILPSLEKGYIVICDRYVDSSVVYQQYVRGVIGVEEINSYAYSNCMPYKTFFFDIEPSIALKRLEDNERIKNRFDEKKIEFHQGIYEAYKKLSLENPKRIIRIDAKQEVDEVVKQIISEIEYDA